MKKTVALFLLLSLISFFVLPVFADGEKCICGRELMGITDDGTTIYVCSGCGNSSDFCTCDCACGSEAIHSDGLLICKTCSKPCADCVCTPDEAAKSGGNETKIGAFIIIGAFIVTALTIGGLLAYENSINKKPPVTKEKKEEPEYTEEAFSEEDNEPKGAGLVAVRLWSRLYIRPDGQIPQADELLAAEISDGVLMGNIEGIEGWCNYILGEYTEEGEEEK